jgi:hypothetical protein
MDQISASQKMTREGRKAGQQADMKGHYYNGALTPILVAISCAWMSFAKSFVSQISGVHKGR